MRAITQFIIAFAALLSIVSGTASAQVVALGASNTAGKGVGMAQAFPAQLQSMLKGMRVTNAGISGNTTQNGLDRLCPQPQSLSVPGDLVAGGASRVPSWSRISMSP